MREITITISDNNITASTDFAGYQGEHNATILKFKLPDNLQSPDYTYQAIIALPDGITATADIRDISLVLTGSLMANSGIIQLQIVITKGGSLVHKSGVTNLKIKPSLAPTAIIGNNNGISSAVVNDEGNLIITLSNGNQINAGYVKGADGKDGKDGKDGLKGDKGDSYDSKHFELIEEITIDSNDVTVIERNQEPNGNAYSFEEVFIAFETEASGSNTTLTCRANNVVSVGISDLIGTEKKYCTLQFQVNKGLLFTTYQIPVTDKTWANSVRARNAEILFAEAINSLRFSCNTPIPLGSKIAIYAVRK